MPVIKRATSIDFNDHQIRNVHMNRQAMRNETYRAKLQQYPPELSRPKLQRDNTNSSGQVEPKHAKEFDQTESVRGTDHKQT
jgi:hypothetical protein